MGHARGTDGRERGSHWPRVPDPRQRQDTSDADDNHGEHRGTTYPRLSLIHISEPTRLDVI
eukprot:12661048-Prorocentrum_lima.AAC.1